MRQIVRPALEWRVLRNLGASLVVAGVSVAAWGGLAVTNVSATATAPDCQTSPPTIACLHDDAGFEGVTATQFTIHNCDFEPGGQPGTTTDGFHFVLPDSQGTAFSILTAWFDVNGSLVIVDSAAPPAGFSVIFTHNSTQAVINAPNGATLLEASATITGGTGTSSDASDGGNPFFVLSSTCPGTGGNETTTTTPTSTTPTSTTPTSTTTTLAVTTSAATTTTTTGGGGNLAVTTSAATSSQSSAGGAAGAAVALPKAGAHMTAPDGTPIGIGIGLAVAGLSMLGIGYRRREIAP